MITALDQPSDFDRAVEAGTDEFVSKPINKNELLLRVARCCAAAFTRKNSTGPWHISKRWNAAAEFIDVQVDRNQASGAA